MPSSPVVGYWQEIFLERLASVALACDILCCLPNLGDAKRGYLARRKECGHFPSGSTLERLEVNCAYAYLRKKLRPGA